MESHFRFNYCKALLLPTHQTDFQSQTFKTWMRSKVVDNFFNPLQLGGRNFCSNFFVLTAHSNTDLELQKTAIGEFRLCVRRSDQIRSKYIIFAIKEI
jgi:hypothetical protein